jgi:hypothetical protein
MAPGVLSPEETRDEPNTGLRSGGTELKSSPIFLGRELELPGLLPALR